MAPTMTQHPRPNRPVHTGGWVPVTVVPAVCLLVGRRCRRMSSHSIGVGQEPGQVSDTRRMTLSDVSRLVSTSP